MSVIYPVARSRRLRANNVIRDLIRETKLSLDDFVFPIFIKDGIEKKVPVSTMPGHFQLTLDDLPQEIKEIQELGIKSIMIFGIPLHKDEVGSDSYDDENGIMQRAIRIIKDLAPDLLIMSDICFCEYTSHGHCGVLKQDARGYCIDNDETLELLVKQTLSHARAGTDVIVPSGMMDGFVHVLRKALDENGFCHLPIMSHSVKYWSAMYGAFGVATEGAAKIGNRSTYQMDPANSNEAIKEVMMDVQEGADIIMVKPAHAYLDIIYKVKQQFPHIPLAAYHTSSEFAMIKAAAANGWIDEKRAAIEVLTGIKRAGADIIVSYYVKEYAAWLREGE